MEKFCLFQIHEYMDMSPRPYVRTFKGDTVEDIEVNAKQFASRMNTNYSGGTTTFVKVLSSEEARLEIAKLIAREERNPQEDSEEFILRGKQLFKDCYNEEY